MKTVFITGANKGIGWETARQLIEKGYFVFLGSRNINQGLQAVDRLKSVGLNNVDCIQIDVTDMGSIRSAKRQLEEKANKLDILINNAGIRGDVPQKASSTPVKQIRRVFETNFFGVIQVTQHCMGLLRKSGEPLIVNITSDLASLTNHNDPEWKYYRFKPAGYGPSKTALNAYTVMLAHELKAENFRVNCINPGHTATDFNDHKGEKPVTQGAAVIVRHIISGTSMETGKFLSEEGETPW